MVMDPRPGDLSSSADDFDLIALHDPSQYLNFANMSEPADEPALVFDSFSAPLLPTEPDDLIGNLLSIDNLSGDLVFPGETDGNLDAVAGSSPCSSSEESNSSDPVLKYISQILMEENLEEKDWIFPDDFALQDTEKSLYDALGEQHPSFPDEFQNSASSSSNLSDPDWLRDLGGYSQTIPPSVHPLDQAPQLNLDYTSPGYASSLIKSIGNGNGLVESSALVTNIMLFKRGLEEASKFLPTSSQLMMNFENVNSGSGDNRGIYGRGRKNHERDDHGLVEGRATKQTAPSVDTEIDELSDLVDKVLLCTENVEPEYSTGSSPSAGASKDCLTRRRGRGRRDGENSSVDLRGLLLQCAKAVSSSDLRAANELLNQIRENSSPSGDGFQRLAHYFADGLEARMAGNPVTSQSLHASVASKRRSVADLMKAYQLHLTACPFLMLPIIYMNYMLWKLSEKATVLHIIDFGIGFGFQWPLLIQKLGESEQDGGPIKLRLTGIDLPLPGFRPADRIEETGRQLARYCERFNVPFEFNALPSLNWESIKIGDLKIKSGEMVVVNCLMRFETLVDETDEECNPRDAVLNLIKRIKPDLFIHAFSNGSYNAPFFVTRFKEALFHMSSLYDMLDAAVCDELRDSDARTVLESEIFGREVMNVVACEGPERSERPEKYKQWQVRHTRAGFKQLPISPEAIEVLRHKLKAWYHKDFVLGEDGNWMLLGWKGRIMAASTCWIPA